jgi:hypothetical protein
VPGVAADRLFIARLDDDAMQLGYYSGESRVVVRTVTPATADVYSNIGFYSNLGADLATIEGLDNFRVLLDSAEIFSGETMIVEGDLMLAAGAILELDIFDPSTVDLLSVTGHIAASGTLEVTLEASAPAPQAGDLFDILDFASADGAFAAFDLPSLAEGLNWNTSNLLTTGQLEVVAGLPGDYNGDGKVDAADYIVWRKTGGGNPAGYNTWRSKYGAGSGGGARDADVTSVPEPTTVVILISMAVASLGCRRPAAR